ncbi:MAG: translocation/assembly module TamB, partial [Muribaculaceae bacterium]|nr:translocation/assembly module TamB [Muribaculaceae bacterium]
KSTIDNVDANIEALLTSVRFNSRTGLQSLIKSFTLATDSVMKQIDRRDLNVEQLQATLPKFNLDINASGAGLVGKYLNTMGMSLDTIHANIANDSLLRADIGARELGNTGMRADTLTLHMLQRGQLLDYQVHMGNRANNPIAEFADVNLNGYLGSNRLLLSLTQKNQKGETGYRLGMTGAFTDSLVSVHFTPLKATIAYLPWKFNTDNHVEYNMLNRHISADLIAESNESSILLKTQTGKNGNDEVHLALKNIKVQDFLRMSVFAPPLTASVNADLNVGYTNQWFYGNGTIGVTGFTYDKIRVGDFDLGLRAGHNTDGTTGALGTLKIDGADALVAKMLLAPDSTGVIAPKKLGLELTDFPLKVANAFLGKDVASLSGRLNGEVDMRGTFNKPLFFGSIACDSVGIYLPIMASSLKLRHDSIKVNDNIVRLKNFDIWGQNNNPLTIDGEVDASNFSNIIFNLKANASNFQLINTDKKSKGDIFGKVFLDLNAGVTGPMAHMNVNANLSVLSTTDVTYSVPQTTVELTQQDASGVVKFVNFNDTTQVDKADTVVSPLAMRIVAGLTIQPGTQVAVNIPGTATTGNGKVEIEPSGTLNYFQNYMGDMRLSGQLNIGNGFARYSVPVVGEKKFTFNPESYVQWSGDIMNPRLSIEATDNIKTNLVENGNSRLVNFLVSLTVGNTLSAPKVLFDLSTDDDMSIQNDLMSMSADQRSMAAINLLLTGQYSGGGVKTASSDMLQGALYGMLTSQLNNWMANNIKGVDLSFGVDQYNKTVNGETGSTTSYSYQMSKSLFNNRFKISVGGNYSTDASADENFSENLISDISFEYILKQTNNLTMYARLFRHTGFESILEGEITETGVGFVMKRRLATLRRLFSLGRHNRRKNNEEKNDSTPALTAPAVNQEDSISKPTDNEDHK